MLVGESEYSCNTVYNRLEVLQAAGYVHVVHDSTRLFGITKRSSRTACVFRGLTTDERYRSLPVD